MVVFPISYYSVCIVLLVFVDQKKGSLFYPYMVLSSVVGIISTIVGLTYPTWDNYQEKYVTTIPFGFSRIHSILFNVMIIGFKILVLLYWPRNTSSLAYTVSGGWVCLYLIEVVLVNTNRKYG